MWRSTYPLQRSSPPGYLYRRSHFIHREFQLRYLLMIFGGLTFGLGLALFPLLYWVNQNYSLFVRLADTMAPKLTQDLQVEWVQANVLVLGATAAILLFTLIISVQLTNRIAAPVRVIQSHLKALSRGHWYGDAAKIRETDEFHDLINDYNYFFSSFRKQLERDLHRLEDLDIDARNVASLATWYEMIRDRREQLGLPTSVSNSRRPSEAPTKEQQAS